MAAPCGGTLPPGPEVWQRIGNTTTCGAPLENESENSRGDQGPPPPPRPPRARGNGGPEPGASPDVPVASARPRSGPAAHLVAAPRWGCPPWARPRPPGRRLVQAARQRSLVQQRRPLPVSKHGPRSLWSLRAGRCPIIPTLEKAQNAGGTRRVPSRACAVRPPTERCVVKATQASLPRRGRPPPPPACGVSVPPRCGTRRGARASGGRPPAGGTGPGVQRTGF